MCVQYLLEYQLRGEGKWWEKRLVHVYPVKVLKLDVLSQWLSTFKKLTLEYFPQKEFFVKASMYNRYKEKSFNSRIVCE